MIESPSTAANISTSVGQYNYNFAHLAHNNGRIYSRDKIKILYELRLYNAFMVSFIFGTKLCLFY